MFSERARLGREPSEVQEGKRKTESLVVRNGENSYQGMLNGSICRHHGFSMSRSRLQEISEEYT